MASPLRAIGSRLHTIYPSLHLKSLIVSLAILAILPAGTQSVAAQSFSYNLTAEQQALYARLVWSTMIMLDNANRTNNYTVLHNLSAPDFRALNSPEQLSTIFQDLRNNRVDLGSTILLQPTYFIPPGFNQFGYLRLRGGFETRPQSIRFDLLYQNVEGGWRIIGISVIQVDSNSPKN